MCNTFAVTFLLPADGHGYGYGYRNGDGDADSDVFCDRHADEHGHHDHHTDPYRDDDTDTDVDADGDADEASAAASSRVGVMYIKEVTMKRVLILFVLCMCTGTAQAALPGTMVWEFNASATGSMVNGGGFNPANAALLTDLTATSATGNAPVLSSASYTFVSGDVGAWVYVKSGTDWMKGWYKISSVDAGAATINATVGAAVQFDTYGNTIPSATAGVATVASPSGGTFGVDYSQSTGAKANNTDLATTDGQPVSGGCVVTSAGHTFTAQEVGNVLHITTGTGWTAGWYEIVSVSGGAATLTTGNCGNDGALSGGTWYLGGALGLNSTLDNEFFAILTGSNMLWMKNGSYSFGEAVSTTAGTCSTWCFFQGYDAIRGDNPKGATRPTINVGVNNWIVFPSVTVRYLIVTGTAGTIFRLNNQIVEFTKVTNTSATINRYAFGTYGGTNNLFAVEAVSQNGDAVNSTAAKCIGCYLHDSNIGFNWNGSTALIRDSVVAYNRTTGIYVYTNAEVVNNTIIGRAGATPIGTGLIIPAGQDVFVNNILYGLTTGMNVTAGALGITTLYNDIYNTATPYVNLAGDITDLALDPQFADVSEIAGSTATTSGSVLTDSGKTFNTTNGGVEDNVDYLHVLSGTGVTTGGYLITGHTDTTLTVNNPLGTSVAGNVVYFVPTGHDFTIGTNLKAKGYPGTFYGAATTTGYLDTGGVQRAEPTPYPTCAP